jgi:hypothetical protein
MVLWLAIDGTGENIANTIDSPFTAWLPPVEFTVTQSLYRK